MLPIQILFIVFFGVTIIRIIARFRGHELSLLAMVGWVLFWVAAAAVVIVPDSTFYFARLVGVGKGADLVVYVSLVIIFYLLFRLLVKLTKIEKTITELTRKLALHEKEEELK